MGQNVLYMLRTAWRTRKSVIALCAAQALLGVASAAVGMFFAPAALGAIETGAPLARLLGIIGAFSCALLLLGALAAYASANTDFGRIQVRMELFYRTMLKSATTALANAENPAFQEKSAKANAAMNSNAAAAEAIWDTLRPYSSRTACPPAGSAMKSPCSTKAGWCKRARTTRLCARKAANTANCGKPRRNTTQTRRKTTTSVLPKPLHFSKKSAFFPSNILTEKKWRDTIPL